VQRGCQGAEKKGGKGGTRRKKKAELKGHTSCVVGKLCVDLARDRLVDVVELILVVLKLLGRHGAPATPRPTPVHRQTEVSVMCECVCGQKACVHKLHPTLSPLADAATQHAH
jgi:hypothetical protein